ncbi:MAG: septum formation initiator family protein [Clostridia bacterium]|nr:septum formation initiator family protein [Clostridia bacterium]
MEEQKLRKIIAVSVSAAVILLVVLISVMVYQMVMLRAGQKNVEALNAEIAMLEDQKEDLERRIDVWQTDWKIDERARELGWLYDYTKR